MNTEINSTPTLQERIVAEGDFSFEWLDEGGRQLLFDPPLQIKWSAYNDTRDNLENLTVYVDYDFGMTDKFRPYASMFHGWHYNDIDKDTELDEIVKAFIQYDLFHAFFHYSQDPNYSHTHWALFGNLKDQTVEVDEEWD